MRLEMTYATPAAFDRAVKKAARATGKDVGAAYRQALRDRFLCRVFFGGNDAFILKGAGGMIARVAGARTTRDLDFATHQKVSAEEALAEMEKVAAIDLGDWCSFRLTRHEESMDENGYSRLLRLRFATYVGREEKDPVLIDLSLDCTTTLPPERVKPANQLSIEGIVTCDYLVYSLPDQLADKLCAIMETRPGGYPSSRMKDLADVVTYVRNNRFALGQLKRAIESECAKRSMVVPERFVAPPSWEGRFEAFAERSGVPCPYATLAGASNLAARLFDPALSPDASASLISTVRHCAGKKGKGPSARFTARRRASNEPRKYENQGTGRKSSSVFAWERLRHATASVVFESCRATKRR